jgi:hypothetical protein
LKAILDYHILLKAQHVNKDFIKTTTQDVLCGYRAQQTEDTKTKHQQTPSLSRLKTRKISPSP